MNNISFFTLGGQDELNRYTGVLRINKSLYLFCAGAGDVNNQIGANKKLPDLEFIEEYKNDIKGIFIGTPKYKLMSSLIYIISILPNVPIYTTLTGKTFILEMWNNLKNTISLNKNIYLKFIIIDINKEISLQENLSLNTFKTFNEIPDTVGWLIKYNQKNIVIIEEFICSNEMLPSYQNQLHLLPQLTNNNVFLLIVGLQSISKNKGYAWPNCCNYRWLKKCVSQSESRIFLSCYKENIWTIINILKIALLYNLSVSVLSIGLWPLIQHISKIECIDFKKINWIKDPRKATQPNTVTLIAENHDQLYEKCHELINNCDKENEYNISLKEKDIFILATETFSGIEQNETELLNEINKYCKTYHLSKNCNSFSAGAEDLKYLVNILKPENIIPVNGYYKDMIEFSKSIKNICKPKSLHFLYNGEEIFFENNTFTEIKNINVSVNYLDSFGRIETKSNIISEKIQMNNSGAVIVNFLYHSDENFFVEPKINFFGVFSDNYSKKDEIIKTCNKVVINEMKKVLFIDKTIKLKKLKLQIKKNLVWTFEKLLQKKPVILTLISHYKNK